jgi:hypothetical protein
MVSGLTMMILPQISMEESEPVTDQDHGHEIIDSSEFIQDQGQEISTVNETMIKESVNSLSSDSQTETLRLAIDEHIKLRTNIKNIILVTEEVR